MRHGPVSAADEARFKRMFEATYREVRCFAERRLRDASAVDDVVSETYLVAWRRLQQLPTDDHEMLLWLYRVAHYGVLNVQRGTRRRHALWQRVRQTASPPAAVRGDRSVVLDDDSETLASAFATLQEEDRSVLLLAAWEGLSGQALAVVLGCSVGAAATRLSRARSRFTDAVRAAEQAGEEWGSGDL